MNGLELLLDQVETLFKGFELTLRTPQLLAVTASCLIDLVEVTFLLEAVYVPTANQEGFQLLEILEAFLGQDDIYQKHICMTYGKRLMNLQGKLEAFEPEYFDHCQKIYNVLNCNIK